MRETANPYIRVGEPVALLAGGQDPPPHCRAAWEPAAPLPGDRYSRGRRANFPLKFLQKSPCRLAAGRSDAGGPGRQAAGYIPVNFENENIFL